MAELRKVAPAVALVAMAAAFATLDPAAAYAQPAIPVRVVNPSLPVTVGGSVTVNPVTVGNPASSPVPTQAVDNPANEPFEFTLCEGTGTWASYCGPGSDTYPVPATSPTTGKAVKRLVVEYVSGYCDAAADTTITSLYLIRSFGGGGVGIGHYVVPVNLATPGFNNYAFAQQTRLYYSPGEGAMAGLGRIGVNQLCQWAASGYLVTQ